MEQSFGVLQVTVEDPQEHGLPEREHLRERVPQAPGERFSLLGPFTRALHVADEPVDQCEIGERQGGGIGAVLEAMTLVGRHVVDGADPLEALQGDLEVGQERVRDPDAHARLDQQIVTLRLLSRAP